MLHHATQTEPACAAAYSIKQRQMLHLGAKLLSEEFLGLSYLHSKSVHAAVVEDTFLSRLPMIGTNCVLTAQCNPASGQRPLAHLSRLCLQCHSITEAEIEITNCCERIIIQGQEDQQVADSHNHCI